MMVLRLDRGLLPDDGAGAHERPSTDQTVMGAATKGRPDGRCPQARARRRSHGGYQAGIRGLDVRGVSKSFAGREVVKGASVHVERGETVALLGPNGAGKTTMFHMITGLVTADRGQIALEGRDITSLPMYLRARSGIGYLPQQASTFRGLTVEQSIQVALDVVEPDRARRDRDLEVLLEEFEIVNLRDKTPEALSGVQRRRTEIARATATRPSYMLLDEPFADLEPTAVDDIQALVRHLARRGIGILIADPLKQSPRQTLDVSDRAYVICAGDILGTLVT
jgi:lipopolysaccharide export system ATP-binding protein